jgi:hypothetical protein
LIPLQKLYGLYNGPSLAIARLYQCTTKLDISGLAASMGERSEQFFSHYTDALDGITLVVMDELPKLYSLTIEAVEECLNTFTRLQTGWFKALRTKLESPGLISPAGLGEIVHWEYDSRKAVESTLSRLAICNGSLLRQEPDHPEDLEAQGS